MKRVRKRKGKKYKILKENRRWASEGIASGAHAAMHIPVTIAKIVMKMHLLQSWDIFTQLKDLWNTAKSSTVLHLPEHHGDLTPVSNMSLTIVRPWGDQRILTKGRIAHRED